MKCQHCHKPSNPKMDARVASERAQIDIKYLHHCPRCHHLLMTEEATALQAEPPASTENLTTRIIKPSALDWPVISAFLEACGRNAIVIPPHLDQRLSGRGIMIADGARVNHTPGEDCITLTIPEEPGDAAVTAIKEQLNLA